MKIRTKQLFATFVILALLMEVCLPMRAKAAASYSSSWVEWRQGQSAYKVMRDSGCRVVAFAKLLSEAGMNDFGTPDDYYDWLNNNSAFTTKNGISENGTFGTLLEKYVKAKGGSITNTRIDVEGKTIDTVCSSIMSYLNQGYYVTISGTFASSGLMHTIYIGREKSIAAGTPILLDSNASSSTGSCVKVYKDCYTQYNFPAFRVYKITPPKTSSSQKAIKVTLNANGGTSSVSNITVYKGEPYGALPTPVRNGYYFQGWFTSKSALNLTPITATSKVTSSKKHTLYARWALASADGDKILEKLNTFIATEYPIGSSFNGSFDNGIQCYGFAKKVVNYLFGNYTTKGKTRSWTYAGVSASGMNTVGYLTKGNYTASKLKKLMSKAKPGDVLQFDTGDSWVQHSMIVYSVGEDSFIVYDANGTSKKNQVALRTIKYGAWKTRGNNKLTLLRSDNYPEAGESGGNSGGSNVKIYSISFNPNGGSVSYSPKLLGKDTSYGKMPTPARKGYTFLGWYTKKSGGTKITEQDKFQGSSGQTLYAHWLKTSEITFTAPTEATYKAKQKIYSNNAVVCMQITKPAGVNVTEAGIYLYDANGSLIKKKDFSVSNVGINTKKFHTWYDMNEEVGVQLEAGKTYQYVMYGIFEGVEVKSKMLSFTTAKWKVTFEAPTDPTYKSKIKLMATNAVVCRKITKPAGADVTELGIYLYNANGKLLKKKAYSVSNVGKNTTLFHTWYDMNSEVDYKLKPRTTYKYVMYGIFDGKEVKSKTYSFTTKAK